MKIECDELLVICDNCGHAIHVKELDNNLIKLNNKNDKLISIQDAIDALIEWYGCKPDDIEAFEEIIEALPSAQPTQNNRVISNNALDTISRQDAIDAFDGTKVDETDCTEYDIGYNDGIDFAVSKLSVLPSAQPEPHGVCMDCLMKNVCRFKTGLGDYGYCSQWKGAEYG